MRQSIFLGGANAGQQNKNLTDRTVIVEFLDTETRALALLRFDRSIRVDGFVFKAFREEITR